MVKKSKKRIFSGFAILFALIYIAVILWHTYKPLPEGVSFEGNVHKTDTVEFITDLVGFIRYKSFLN